MVSDLLDFDKDEREAILTYLSDQLESFYGNTRQLNVTPDLEVDLVRKYVSSLNIDKGVDPFSAIDHIVEGMKQFAIHTPHPSYFGLFNPRANFASILADLTTAVFNPQMAAWSHNPFANEVERLLVREMGKKFGYREESVDGNFGAGGAEANLTALLCALARAYPEYLQKGLNNKIHKPLIYCSSEAHHSVQRAARICGLGADAVRAIATDEDLCMIADIANAAIIKDRSEGFQPLMLVATAGTTGSGSIDPLSDLAKICNKEGLWFHVDAAFGGAVILDSKGQSWLKGIAQSHSITIDVHKWMSVPMGASMFITRIPNILDKTFGIHAAYMPSEENTPDIFDPYLHSIQWSRRFIGLKLYFSLAFYGWKGYASLIQHSLQVGAYLKDQLEANGWKIWVKTPLPVVCFSDKSNPKDHVLTQKICTEMLKTGKTWISIYPINKTPTLRACITNYATNKKDVNDLIDLLEKVRNQIRKDTTAT